jgi:hypothetical protein
MWWVGNTYRVNGPSALPGTGKSVTRSVCPEGPEESGPPGIEPPTPPPRTSTPSGRVPIPPSAPLAVPSAVAPPPSGRVPEDRVPICGAPFGGGSCLKDDATCFPIPADAPTPTPRSFASTDGPFSRDVSSNATDFVTDLTPFAILGVGTPIFPYVSLAMGKRKCQEMEMEMEKIKGSVGKRRVDNNFGNAQHVPIKQIANLAALVDAVPRLSRGVVVGPHGGQNGFEPPQTPPVRVAS